MEHERHQNAENNAAQQRQQPPTLSSGDATRRTAAPHPPGVLRDRSRIRRALTEMARAWERVSPVPPLPQPPSPFGYFAGVLREATLLSRVVFQ